MTNNTKCTQGCRIQLGTSVLGNADRPLGQDKGMQDGHAAGVMGERDQLQGYTLYAPTSKSKKK